MHEAWWSSLSLGHRRPPLTARAPLLRRLSTGGSTLGRLVQGLSAKSWSFDVAAEFNAPYLFFPSTAIALSIFFHLPTLNQEVHCEYRDLPELVKISGCIPLHGRELLDPVQHRKDEAYKWLLHHAKRYTEAEGNHR
ncbi:hypothetical protein VIGAN_11159900 [Vigna angularis var. angularis]|uniref:Uncharacterized protein n=1 Tax=Vigna angularis var. angularis TaxID=157739 RepID=A0A0S3TAV8_PHAAN|nr:hypothetical protein VIGAN_11159900 [Vigna angularis var. angularis]